MKPKDANKIHVMVVLLHVIIFILRHESGAHLVLVVEATDTTDDSNNKLIDATSPRSDSEYTRATTPDCASSGDCRPSKSETFVGPSATYPKNHLKSGNPTTVKKKNIKLNTSDLSGKNIYSSLVQILQSLTHPLYKSKGSTNETSNENSSISRMNAVRQMSSYPNARDLADLLTPQDALDFTQQLDDYLRSIYQAKQNPEDSRGDLSLIHRSLEEVSSHTPLWQPSRLIRETSGGETKRWSSKAKIRPEEQSQSASSNSNENHSELADSSGEINWQDNKENSRVQYLTKADKTGNGWSVVDSNKNAYAPSSSNANTDIQLERPLFSFSYSDNQLDGSSPSQSTLGVDQDANRSSSIDQAVTENTKQPSVSAENNANEPNKFEGNYIEYQATPEDPTQTSDLDNPTISSKNSATNQPLLVSKHRSPKKIFISDKPDGHRFSGLKLRPKQVRMPDQHQYLSTIGNIGGMRGSDVDDTPLRVRVPAVSDISEGSYSINRPSLSPRSIQLQQVYPIQMSPSAVQSTQSSPSSNQYFLQPEAQPQPQAHTTQQATAVYGLSQLNGLQALQAAPTIRQFTQQQPVGIGAQIASYMSSRNPLGQRDLQNQPQTLQITALPNNAANLAPQRLNAMGFNNLALQNNLGLVGNNLGLVGGNMNGFMDPLGRLVLAQNADRREIEWPSWFRPALAVITVPFILGSIFVPLFLKTVIIFIQLLQSLGLLLPLTNAVSKQIAQAAGALVAASSVVKT